MELGIIVTALAKLFRASLSKVEHFVPQPSLNPRQLNLSHFNLGKTLWESYTVGDRDLRAYQHQDELAQIEGSIGRNDYSPLGAGRPERICSSVCQWRVERRDRGEASVTAPTYAKVISLLVHVTWTFSGLPGGSTLATIDGPGGTTIIPAGCPPRGRDCFIAPPMHQSLRSIRF